MKRYAVAVIAVVMLSGCSSVVTKHFNVIADPSDAQIRVVSGTALSEATYTSPASITAEVPKDPALARKTRLEVSKENYTPTVLTLQQVDDGQTVLIKLDKIIRTIVRYRLSFALESPKPSRSLSFHDRTISVAFTVKDRAYAMKFRNLSRHKARILWDRAEYTDVNNDTHRLMHSGIRFEDRNNPLPAQTVAPGKSIEADAFPVSNVVLKAAGQYEVQPLFSLFTEDAASLKGKSVILFIPVEVNRQIIPYNFKIRITDSVREVITN